MNFYSFCSTGGSLKRATFILASKRWLGGEDMPIDHVHGPSPEYLPIECTTGTLAVKFYRPWTANGTQPADKYLAGSSSTGKPTIFRAVLGGVESGLGQYMAKVARRTIRGNTSSSRRTVRYALFRPFGTGIWCREGLLRCNGRFQRPQLEQGQVARGVAGGGAVRMAFSGRPVCLKVSVLVPRFHPRSIVVWPYLHAV